MALLIRALSLNDEPLSQPIQGVFDESGGTIGRADSNTMTLPDPERLISREHAKVTCLDGQYWIEDVGGGVSSVLNGKPVGLHNRVPLRINDELRISAYRLTVDTANEDAFTVLRQRTGAHALLAGTGGGVAALGRTGPPPRLRPPAGLSAVFPQVLPAVPPDDFDPFGDPHAHGAEKSTGVPSAFDDPLGVLANGPAKAGSLDKDFGLSAGSTDDALAGFLAGRKPGAPRPTADPANARGAIPAGGSPPAPAYALPNHVPEIRSGYTPPRVLSDPPQDKPAPARAEPPDPAEIAVLWGAFLDGLGLPSHFPQKPTPHVMRTVGTMMRQMVEGTLQLIRARSIAKNQLRAEATLIEPRNNNPLKFSPDARAALAQLLQPPQAGFLPASEAVRDAFEDLQSHQIGTMAGMRAALEGLLVQFEPALLERQLSKRSALDALLPSSRKARLWDMYVQHFESIRTEAEENFHDLYGKAFIAAYEKQVERLRRAQANEQP